MTKLFVASPTYDGRVDAKFALALVETFAALAANGVQMQLYFDSGGTLLVSSRNRIMDVFLQSDCTHILCVDSDLAWRGEAVIRALRADVAFVAGVYPSRKNTGFVFTPTLNPDGTLRASKGMLEMEGVPAGFMLLTRECIETIRKAHPQREYVDKPPGGTPKNMFSFFNTEVIDGVFWGEDYVFCKLAREAGFVIHVIPDIVFDHAGVVGTLTDVLVRKEDIKNEVV